MTSREDPMTHPTTAVTGVTGAVGRKVATLLADARRPQRLLARSPARAPRLPASVVLPVGYADTAASAVALRGVELLFMVSASESADRLAQHRAFIDAARDAGVAHVVYTSFQGAAPDAVFTLARGHYATEEHIKASGMTWTFLRDSFYLDFMPEMVGGDGVIRGPAGAGRVAAVARDDVARVAASVLLDPRGHENVTYDVTGPEALAMPEIADAIAAARGTPVTFHDESIAEAYESRRAWAAPDWQYDAWVSTYTAIAAGQVSSVSTAVQDITGRPPISLAQFLAGDA